MVGKVSLRTSPVAQTIDIRGKVCPYTLVLTKKALDGVKGGDVIKVICDHAPAAEDTIPAYCEKQGYECEVINRNDEGYWEVYIKKA